MIGTIIAVVALLAFTLFAAQVTDEIKARKAKVSCQCGELGDYTVYVVDSVDAVRIRQSLTEQCFNCRCNRLSHRPDPYVEPVAYVETPDPVASAPRGGRPNRDRKGASAPNPNRDRKGATSANRQSSIDNLPSPGGSIDVVA